MRRFCGILLFALLAAAMPALATITDDIDPQGNVAVVEIINPDPVKDSGWVQVEVVLQNGQTAIGSAPYTIGPNTTSTVDVKFKGGIDVIILGGITECPDPVCP